MRVLIYGKGLSHERHGLFQRSVLDGRAGSEPGGIQPVVNGFGPALVIDEFGDGVQQAIGYCQINYRKAQSPSLLSSYHCRSPIRKRTFPKVPIVLCSDQVASEIEQGVDNRVGIQETLRLP